MIVGGYGAELSAAWADHLAPRTHNAPTVVSLFAGAGGSSLGYSMAGFRELLAVEWDDHAAACLSRNLATDVSIYHGDVTHVLPADLPLAVGELDVLDGSPPCQGFSTAGKRQLDDPRNQLFREYVRLLRAWQPRAFVMENVAGMAAGKMQAVFAEIRASLQTAGYRISTRKLIASYYRVPQRRGRIIIIGIRADLAINPSHPLPVSRELSVGEALHDLVDPGAVRIPDAKNRLLLPHVRAGENAAKLLRRHDKAGSYFNTVRLVDDAPAPTLTRSPRSYFIHPRYNRLLGTAELSRLCSFPDEYDWDRSNPVQIQSRLGNAVPPLLMRAIATHLRTLLDAA